jgi:hypothetical protein
MSAVRVLADVAAAAEVSQQILETLRAPVPNQLQLHVQH